MGQIYVRSSSRAKAHYRSGRRKSSLHKSSIFKVKQSKATHAGELSGRGSLKVLKAQERRTRRFSKILFAKQMKTHAFKNRSAERRLSNRLARY